MSPVRPTIIGYEAVAEKVVGQIVHIVVGLFFMLGGAWAVYYGFQHPLTAIVNGVTVTSINKVPVYGGAGTVLLGALVMPTILPLFQQIFIFVQAVPIVGNFIGGRRATDPPAASPETKP